MQHKQLILKVLSATLIPLSLSACSTLGYYSQSIRGQLDVMTKRIPISDLLHKEETPPEKKKVLQKIQQLRSFASESLLLPNNRSYKSYVELGREFVVWNVFAAPEFSVKPVTSCFLIVGCLQYRGFFNRDDAIDHAVELQSKGDDVYVAGVSAYSTLGWFDDPVLSSMLAYGESRLAEVIFHELAHQLVYVRNDTAFNEAFATAVGEIGVRRWLKSNGRETDLAKYERRKRWEHAFIGLILTVKSKLEKLYGTALPEKEMRSRKAAIFNQMRADYQHLKSTWEDPPDYDKWMSRDLNNAKIASVVTYHELTEAFNDLLDRSDGDLKLFYQRVRHLGSLPKKQRHRCLDNMDTLPNCFP